MEFPHIGTNCNFKSCNKLDFLPVKCAGCKGEFCLDHFAFDNHDCPEPKNKDVKVPVCPLCNAPVPGRRGEPADIAVSAHIDNQCTSDPAVQRRKKIFTNKCNFKGCKTKELIPVVCKECTLNFCLKHRHTTDHSCQGKLAAKRRQAAEAAMARIKATEQRVAQPVPAAVASFTDVQGTMSEDEALAHALALSLQDEVRNNRTNDNNFAQALNRQRVGGEQNSRCNIS